MVSDENHEFLFDVTARRKSRANSEISELLTARRMDITVWMSSQTMPTVAGRERHGCLAADSFSGPGAAPVAAWALVYPRVGDGARRQPGSCWPYAAGDNSRRRVSLLTHEYAGTLWSNVGQTFHASAGPHDSWGRVVQLAAVALPWTSFLVWGPLL
ncbi:hypothetical protein EVAR_25842_1 [Eumeta japonica]|uniref:Uncharacterized protein n=1 Tax=Eumeta variegata TaxID=151549 RepID=A0A4C1VWK8_EUMVA|nr:hypothetical protein EVAR_25842_1 [Eumeta japonica]